MHSFTLKIFGNLQDEEITFVKRREKSDIRELRRVYHTYKDYIIQNGGAVDLENR